jgi:hypothetical protein
MEARKQPKITFPAAALQCPPTDPTRALMELICTSRLPFSIASDPSLAHFVQAVQKHKEWKVPHRTTLAGPELDNVHADVVASLKKEFSTCDYIALTVDGTDGAGGTSFWSVTASGLDGEFELHTAVLACVPAHKNHSGKNLAEVVHAVLNSSGISASKVVAIVTDEGGRAPCIIDHFPGAYPIFYAAHILQTTLRRAFDASVDSYPELGQVLTFAKRLAAQYNNTAGKPSYQAFWREEQG